MRCCRRAAALLAAVQVVTSLGGCGSADAVDQARQRIEKTGQDLQHRIEKARTDYEKRRDRFKARFKEILAQLEQAVPQAQQTSPTVRTRGRDQPGTIDAFLTDILKSVDRYWERTFAKAGLPAPRISYSWVPPGRQIATGCGTPAGDDAAFYCPVDDTIYVAQTFAAQLDAGQVRGLPGESAGYGRAQGDFAVAYVVAHEYAHNVQQELGLFDNRVSRTAEPYELQADCYAGTWANSEFQQGLLSPADLKQVTDAALAVGDFDLGNAQHHGTPVERRDALLTGYRGGDPAACARFVPAV